jgi:hypothetical protein
MGDTPAHPCLCPAFLCTRRILLWCPFLFLPLFSLHLKALPTCCPHAASPSRLAAFCRLQPEPRSAGKGLSQGRRLAGAGRREGVGLEGGGAWAGGARGAHSRDPASRPPPRAWRRRGRAGSPPPPGIFAGEKHGSPGRQEEVLGDPPAPPPSWANPALAQRTWETARLCLGHRRLETEDPSR